MSTGPCFALFTVIPFTNHLIELQRPKRGASVCHVSAGRDLSSLGVCPPNSMFPTATLANRGGQRITRCSCSWLPPKADPQILHSKHRKPCSPCDKSRMVGKQTLPWDYFPLVRDTPSIEGQQART